MKHLNILFVILVIIPISLFSQEKINFKNDKNEVIEFEVSTKSYFIKYQNKNKTDIQNKVEDFIPISKNEALITIENINGSFLKFVFSTLIVIFVLKYIL